MLKVVLLLHEKKLPLLLLLLLRILATSSNPAHFKHASFQKSLAESR